MGKGQLTNSSGIRGFRIPEMSAFVMLVTLMMPSTLRLARLSISARSVSARPAEVAVSNATPASVATL
jgi:hypothetical protein